ncbi:hypothetical protein [Streptomyces sp. NPDC001652]|uniref:hypothetical protein n=1 Tax=Streptomyces sp. NPDC001652 TaxID=3154393 RepID=UPI003328A84F
MAAARAAVEFPAHLVASDLLRVHVPSLGACDVAESRPQVTVLRDEIEPGSEAQIDYDFLGWSIRGRGKRRRVWGLADRAVQSSLGPAP